MVRWLRGHLRMTGYHRTNEHFQCKNGLLYATPLMLVLIPELSDVISPRIHPGYLRRDIDELC